MSADVTLSNVLLCLHGKCITGVHVCLAVLMLLHASLCLVPATTVFRKSCKRGLLRTKQLLKLDVLVQFWQHFEHNLQPATIVHQSKRHFARSSCRF
jgi:hypothetical protein